MRYVVVHDRYSCEVEAETIEAAALEAAKMTSVLSVRRGVEMLVYPAESAKIVRVQYKYPNATGGGPDERLPDYGNIAVVEEFQPVEEHWLVK